MAKQIVRFIDGDFVGGVYYHRGSLLEVSEADAAALCKADICARHKLEEGEKDKVFRPDKPKKKKEKSDAATI